MSRRIAGNHFCIRLEGSRKRRHFKSKEVGNKRFYGTFQFIRVAIPAYMRKHVGLGHQAHLRVCRCCCSSKMMRTGTCHRQGYMNAIFG